MACHNAVSWAWITSIDRTLAGDAGKESFRERQANLSSAWRSYGQALLISENVTEARHAFKGSLEHGYLAGDASAFLASITEVIHRCHGMADIRGSMRIAEAGIRVADRIGAIRVTRGLQCYGNMFVPDDHTYAKTEGLRAPL